MSDTERELVSAWLDDDRDLRIPDTEWGHSLAQAIKALVGQADAHDPQARAEERERIAEAIEALEYSRPEVSAAVRSGVSLEYIEGWDSACLTAARIARAEPTDTEVE